MPLAVSKDVQDELLAIRADLEWAMLKFIREKQYGAAERMLVIVDRSLHNLIRDAAIVSLPNRRAEYVALERRQGLDDVQPPSDNGQNQNTLSLAQNLMPVTQQR